MMKAAVAAILVALAGYSLADDGPMRVGKVELYPTWSAVGIEVSYAGDDTNETQGSFVWRRDGETQWRNGVDMTFDRARKFIWASVWPLEQGETIQVRIDATGPRAEKPYSWQGVVATKAMVLEPARGAAVYYVSPEGSDVNPGTRELPFGTLRHAASIVRAGEAVYAMNGVYREGDLFSRVSGAPGSPVIFAAAEGEHPILDGATEIPKGADRWQSLGDGIYSIDFPSPPSDVAYVAEDGERVFPYHTAERMKADILETGWKERYTVARGWFYDAGAGKLYVRYVGGGSPADHSFSIPAYDYGVLFSGSHDVVLKGFEIRNYGHACVRISEGSTGCVVYGNDLHNAQAGVFVYGEKTAGNAVWKNRIVEPSLAKYSWCMNKSSGNNRQGITGWVGYRGMRGYDSGRMGRGMSFCYNEIAGWFDGIMPGGWNRVDRLDLSRDMDIMFNYIYDIGDDAIEVDSGAVNQRVHGNKVRNAFAAFALAPVEKGPVYFTRNDATFFVLGFKCNVGGPATDGWAYIYHNSLYCVSKGDTYGGTGISFANGEAMPTANKVFKNNALIVDGKAVRFYNARNTVDYNCYWNVPGQEPPFFTGEIIDPSGTSGPTWSTRASKSSAKPPARRRTAWSPTRSTAPPPPSAPSVRGEYGPLPFTDFTSKPPRTATPPTCASNPPAPASTPALAIRGINEDFTGKAPDIGAHEYQEGD